MNSFSVVSNDYADIWKSSKDFIALSFSKLELSQASIKDNLFILGTLTYKDLLYLCD